MAERGSLDNRGAGSQVRRDKIDILVDPVMHMADNRLLMFTQTSANTDRLARVSRRNGPEAMDYRLTDKFLDPLDSDCSQYVEESIRLPDWWACYESGSDAVPAVPRPPEWKDPICFGSLNNPCKMNPPTIRLWAHAQRRPAFDSVVAGRCRGTS